MKYYIETSLDKFPWCESVFDMFDSNTRPSDYLRGFHYAAVEIGNMFED
jgi:hypothetical protein